MINRRADHNSLLTCVTTSHTSVKSHLIRLILSLIIVHCFSPLFDHFILLFITCIHYNYCDDIMLQINSMNKIDGSVQPDNQPCSENQSNTSVCLLTGTNWVKRATELGFRH